MRRRGTALVVGAVAAIAILGITDAIRSNADEPVRVSAPTTTREEPAPSEAAAVARELRARGIGGLLYAVVRRAGRCRLDVIGLPTLNRSTLFELATCRIRVSPTGLIAAGRTCPGGRVTGFTAQSRMGTRRFRGCAPAWRPDGRLTFVNRRGDVVELIEPCASMLPCLNVVLPHGRAPKPIRDLAWLDENRLAALVAGRHPVARWLAIFEDGSLVEYEETRFALSGAYLQAIGNRLYLAAGDPPSDVLGYDSSGRFVTRDALPTYLADGRAFTASPDGKWIASTLGDSVQIYRAGVRQPLDPVALDLAAVDLGWVG